MIVSRLHRYSPRQYQLWCQTHAVRILKGCFRLCPKLCLCLLTAVSAVRYGISISITLEYILIRGQTVCVQEKLQCVPMRWLATACRHLPTPTTCFVWPHVATYSSTVWVKHGQTKWNTQINRFKTDSLHAKVQNLRGVSSVCPKDVAVEIPELQSVIRWTSDHIPAGTRKFSMYDFHWFPSCTAAKISKVLFPVA